MCFDYTQCHLYSMLFLDLCGDQNEDFERTFILLHVKEILLSTHELHLKL